MRKNIYILTAIVCAFIAGNTAVAQHNTADTLALRTIQANNFSAGTMLNWATESNPDLWIGVIWDSSTPKRVIRLNLSESTCNDGTNNGADTTIGIDMQLTGVLDISGLSEITSVEFRRVVGLTGLTVTGLTKLTNVTASRSGLTSIDLSGIASFNTLRAKDCPSLLSVDVSNCGDINTLSLASNDVLNSLTATNCGTIAKLAIRDNGGIVTSAGYDFTGTTLISRIKGRRSALTSVDMSDFPNVTRFGFANSTFLTTVTNAGSAVATNILGFRNCAITDIQGIETISGIAQLNFSNSKLKLVEAVKASFNPIVRSAGSGAPHLNQTPYANSIVTQGNNVDYSDQATADSNGTTNTTVFTLYDATNTLQSTNSTGIFTMNTVGDFYVIMVNSTVSIRTGTITVVGPCTGGFDTGDSTTLINFANANFTSGTNLNWLTASCPQNWFGVTWDNGTPRRVTELRLMESSSNGGGNGEGSWGDNKRPTSFSVSKLSGLRPGVSTELTGSMDFTSLTELTILALNDNADITSIDVSGLNNLEHLYVGKTKIKTLDISGLTSLLLVKAGGTDSLTTVNASGCTSLLRLKKTGEDNFTSLDVTGCNDLEQLNVKRSGLTSMDLTGKTNLLRLAVSRSANLTSIVGLSTCTNMEGLGMARCDLSGVVDVSGMDSLARIGARINEFTSFTGLRALTNLDKVNIDENRVQLTEAAQIGSMLSGGNSSANPQGPSYVVNDIVYVDSIDFSAEDSVDINGTNVNSSFNLYNDAGSLISNNNTGVFNFTQADTGCYYVILANSGINVSTDTFCVLGAAAIANVSIDNANFGTVFTGANMTRTLTISNSGNIDLSVSNITVPAGYTVASTSATVAGGSSTDVTVTFSPTLAQTYAGDLEVTSNGVSGGSSILAITGIGVVDSTIGILENGKRIIEFYPNPTTGTMFIKDNTSNYRTLYLYNATGTLVREINVVNQTGKIEFGALPTGSYIVRSQDGKVSQKLIRY